MEINAIIFKDTSDTSTLKTDHYQLSFLFLLFFFNND